MPIDLSEALALHQQGNLDRASQLYESALKADPSSDLAIHLLGMVAMQRGDHAKALDLLARAIQLKPLVAEYHGGIAEAYWSIGQVDRAVASAQEALSLAPGNWLVRSNLGRFLVAQRQFEAALVHLRAVIQIKPDFAPAYTNLGHAYRHLGSSRAAKECFREAVRLDPMGAVPRGDLGKFLLERGELEEALEHCREATRLQPNGAYDWIRLGNVLQVMGKLEDAETCLRRAIQLQPEIPDAHAMLGGVLEQLGETELSLLTFREALRLQPHHAGVLGRLATRLGVRLPESDQAAIESLLAASGLLPDQRAPLLFGLAHVLDAKGEFDRAAELANQANGLQHAGFEHRGTAYNAQTRANEMEQIIEAFNLEFFDRVEGWGLSTELPIFIVGMPRSGTSLVEQILASHSRIFGAGELRLVSEMFQSFVDSLGRTGSLREIIGRLDRTSLNHFAQRHLDHLVGLGPTADRVVDKMPENSLLLGMIAAMFPRARVIYCRRDPRDIALSCWMTHFGEVRWSCDPSHIQSRILETDRIMEHWRRSLRLPILEVVYEDLVANLETSSRDLVAWSGLDWEPACLEFYKTRRQVKTASVLQVREPIYRRSVGRWKNYQQSLAFLFDKLTP